MAKKNTDSQLPVLLKPDPVPEWIPQTSDSVSTDDIVREIAVIGFDREGTPPETRLKALEKLAKHKNMYVERSESRHIDGTKVEIAKEMFRNMSAEERRDWLQQHMDRPEAHAIPVNHEVIDDPAPESRKSDTLEKLHGK